MPRPTHAYHAAKYGLRFAHASMRLRDRYGITLTEEMYDKANQQFAMRTAYGVLTNRRGDLEGWCIIKPENPDEGEAQLVPAVYCVSDGLIATFFAKPPELTEAELAKAQIKLGYGVAPKLALVSSQPAEQPTPPTRNRKERLAAERADSMAMTKALEDAAHFEVRAWLRSFTDVHGEKLPERAKNMLRNVFSNDPEIRAEVLKLIDFTPLQLVAAPAIEASHFKQAMNKLRRQLEAAAMAGDDRAIIEAAFEVSASLDAIQGIPRDMGFSKNAEAVNAFIAGRRIECLEHIRGIYAEALKELKKVSDG